MTMKREKYTRPTCSVIFLNRDLMEGLPIGPSGTTYSGDDSGGGLAKKGAFNNDEGEDKIENYHVWADEE